jgi:O-antigen/teichoic acid export membrane protein
LNGFLRMKKNLSITFIATIVIQVVTMVGGIISARLLLPQGKGELTAIILWPSMLASVGSLGIFDAVVYYAANESGYREKKVFASAMVLVLGLSGVLVGIGYLVIPWVLSGYSAQVVSTALLYLCFIPINLITLCQISFLLGKMRLAQYNFLRSFVHVATVAGMIGLYIVGWVSVRTFAITSLAANIGILVLAVRYMVVFRWFGGLPQLSFIKKLLAYGLRAHLGSVASLFNLRLDQMLISMFLAPSVLGLYVVAVTISAGGSLAAVTITMVVFPHLANLSSDQLRRQALGRYMKLSLFLSLTAAVLLLLVTPWIIRVFFGTSFIPATHLAQILILASIPLGCNALLGAAFKAFNKPFVSSKAEMLGLAVTAIFLITLLPILQALGAALASLLSYSSVFLYMVWKAQVELDLPLWNLFFPCQDDLTYLKQLLSRMQRAFGT